MKDTTQSSNKSALSRRTFLKSSAVAGAGILAMPVGASAYVQGDDAIKIALIGCGGRGRGAAVQALSTSQNVKLVAMAEAFRDRLDMGYTAIKKGLEENGGDLSRIAVAEDAKFVGFDAYKQAIDMADVVILTTPPGFRPIHFEYAVQNDKQVFMEKPVATDAPGIRKVLEVAEMAKKKKLNVVVGLQRHYQTVYREWVDRIHNGVIGDIVGGSVYWNGGGVWTRERKPGMTEMEYQMLNWYYFNWLCGDHIVEQHIHNIDVANWVLKGYPVKAQGMGGRQVRTSKEHGEIFDHHFVEFEYENGIKIASQCRHIKGCMNRVSESFMGTNGRAPKPGELVTPNGYNIWKHRGKGDPNPYQVEHDELFAAIAKGEYKYADAYNGAMSTMSAIFGRMATYSGQELTMEDALKSDVSIMPTKFAWDADPPVMPNKDGYYPIPTPGSTKVI